MPVLFDPFLGRLTLHPESTGGETPPTTYRVSMENADDLLLEDNNALSREDAA